jgi:hypothetical protein
MMLKRLCRRRRILRWRGILRRRMMMFRKMTSCSAEQGILRSWSTLILFVLRQNNQGITGFKDYIFTRPLDEIPFSIF